MAIVGWGVVGWEEGRGKRGTAGKWINWSLSAEKIKLCKKYISYVLSSQRKGIWMSSGGILTDWDNGTLILISWLCDIVEFFLLSCIKNDCRWFIRNIKGAHGVLFKNNPAPSGWDGKRCRKRFDIKERPGQVFFVVVVVILFRFFPPTTRWFFWMNIDYLSVRCSS